MATKPFETNVLACLFSPTYKVRKMREFASASRVAFFMATANNNVFILGPALSTFSAVIEYNSVSNFQVAVLQRNEELNKDVTDSTEHTQLSPQTAVTHTATRT